MTTEQAVDDTIVFIKEKLDRVNKDLAENTRGDQDPVTCYLKAEKNTAELILTYLRASLSVRGHGKLERW